MGLRPNELLIDDSTNNDVVFPKSHARGLIPRDLNRFPRGCYATVAAVDFPLIPTSEYSERIKYREETKSQLSHLRRISGPNGGHIPSLDQNGVGYCWNHSATMANMLNRAVAGLPYVKLSAFAVGCMIKNYKDEGGWGALALDFLTTKGQPSVDFWPEKSMDRKNDNPQTWENALLHKVTEGWIDLATAVYDRNLSDQQICTLLLSGIPVISDFNWWGHSVVLLDLVEVEPGSFGKRGLNSWTDSYGDLGEFVLRGSKAHVDGAVAPRAGVPSLV